MVVNLGHVLAEDWESVLADIRAVVDATAAVVSVAHEQAQQRVKANNEKSKKNDSSKDALYDMKMDPAQTTNIIEQHPDVAKAMREAYDEFWKETRPLMVNEDAPMSPTKPYHELFNKQTAEGGIPAWKAPKL